MKKLAYYIGILVCTSIFASSCIKEDLSSCPERFVIDGLVVPHFVIVPVAGSNPAIVDDSLYTGQVYVYDEQGNFVATYQIPGRPQLNKTYTPDWGLPAGNYTYATWLNNNQSFQVDPSVVGQSVQSQTLLQLIIPQTKVVNNTGNIPFLCYGHLNNEYLDSTKSNLITIPVMQYTNRINLKVTGLSNTPGSDYTFSIRDNNESYGFDGAFASTDYFTYSTTNQANGDVLNASLNVLKLAGNRPNPTVVITNNTTGETFSAGLIQLILASNPNNDFDKTHVYNITMTNPFGSEMDIPFTITINDWIVDQSNVELTIE